MDHLEKLRWDHLIERLGRIEARLASIENVWKPDGRTMEEITASEPANMRYDAWKAAKDSGASPAELDKLLGVVEGSDA